MPCFPLSACLSAVCWGAVNDQLTTRRGARLGRCGLAVFAMAVASAFIAFGAQAQSARVASVVLAGGAGTLYLSQGSFWSVTADIAGASSGSVSGFMNMGAQLGGALSAWLTPRIASHFNWTASFLIAAALCLLGGLCWLAVDPSRSLESQPLQVTAES